MKPVPITFRGADYPSLAAAGRANGMSGMMVRYHLNPQAEQARQRDWHANNPEKSRALRRKLAGKPAPTYPETAHCECCEELFTKVPHLDHCHLTDRFRGWLCSRCNTALGLLRESAALCRKAAAYLERPR